MQKFQFCTASPLKMRACGTGKKFAEYDQRGTYTGKIAGLKIKGKRCFSLLFY
jgi:hypothetical protein